MDNMDKFAEEVAEEYMEMEDKMDTTNGDGKKNHAHKSMMTMDDVSKCLKKDFPEEIADAKRYLCMAKIAYNAGDENNCHYLLEMAKDEYTHAVFIHEFMENCGMCIPEHHERCYRELEKEMAEFF